MPQTAIEIAMQRASAERALNELARESPWYDEDPLRVDWENLWTTSAPSETEPVATSPPPPPEPAEHPWSWRNHAASRVFPEETLGYFRDAMRTISFSSTRRLGRVVMDEMATEPAIVHDPTPGIRTAPGIYHITARISPPCPGAPYETIGGDGRPYSLAQSAVIVTEGDSHDRICDYWRDAYEGLVELARTSGRSCHIGHYEISGPHEDRGHVVAPNRRHRERPPLAYFESGEGMQARIDAVPQDKDGQLLFFARDETPKAPSRKTRSNLLSTLR